MAEVAAEIPTIRRSAGLRATVLAIAWRNLWRNPRRTWLMAGGIAFAIWMLAFAFALQKGAFDVMTDNGARLWIGHAQIQHPKFEDEPLLENVITDASRLRRAVEALDGVVTVVPRAEAAALVSAGERSFGAMVVGVEAVDGMTVVVGAAPVGPEAMAVVGGRVACLSSAATPEPVVSGASVGLGSERPVSAVSRCSDADGV